MDPQKLQLDWWYWLWKPTKQTVEVLFKWNEKNFLFKTQISLIFSCVHFSQGKIPTQKKKTRQNSPPKNGRVLGEFLASRRVFFTRPHSMPRWGQNPYFFEAFRFFWIYAQSTRKPPKISGQRWFWGVVWGCSIGETPQRYKKMEKNSKNRPFWPFGPYWSKWPFLTNISKKKQNFVIIRPVWAQICPKNVPRVHSDLF